MKSTIVLDKINQKFVDELEKSKSPPIYTLEPQKARQILTDLQSKIKLDESDLLIETIQIENKDVKIKLIRPKKLGNQILPCLIYIHGGGWILGTYQSHRRLVDEIASKAQIIIAFIDYQPSPEAQYKKILVQIHQSIDYLVKNAAKHKIDPEKLLISGDSVGGNMAIVMTLYADPFWPRFKHQFLMYPVTSAAMDTESYRQYMNGPWLTAKAMAWFWDAYAPGVNRDALYFSPLNASPQLLKEKNVPPALVIVDNDVLRDEGEAYANLLMKAGIETVGVRFLGTMHDFLMLDSLKDSVVTKAAMNLLVDTIKKTIG